ncbi:energy transducer TonB [Roseateles sp. L2-2]|uniref:energy transducer TonB n=1 Tax=Roseateles TaxID=93681 RepID=UPI003D366083
MSPRWTGWAVTGAIHVAMLLALASAFSPQRPPAPVPLTISARLVPSKPTSEATPPSSISIQLPRSALSVPPTPDIPPPPVQIEITPPIAVAATPLRFDPPAAAQADQESASARPVAVAVAAVSTTATASPSAPTTTPAPATTDVPVQMPADHRACSARQIERHYPGMLRDRGIEGRVVLRVKVDADGHAAEVVVAGGSGWRLLDEAARRVAEACPFVPARRGDQRLVSWVEYPVRFALQASPLQ